MSFYIRLGLVILSFLWFVGSLLPFCIEYIPFAAYLLPFADMLYDPVCHQISSKKFCIDTACSLVCSRCLGIYAGFVFSSLLILFFNPTRFYKINYLLYAAFPMLFDVIFVSAGFYEYSIWTALISGFIFGCAAFYYFYKGVYQINVDILHRRSSDNE